VPVVARQPVVAAPARTFTYSVAGKAQAGSLESFAAQAADTLAASRGWSLGGSVAFRRVSSGGDFTLWLSSPAAVASFGSPCHPSWSCRSGRNAIINERNWENTTDAWRAAGGSVRDYRHMVVNHEVGHWLGLGHASCSGAGRPAPVMQQQSKSLAGCAFNPWPLASERSAVAGRFGVQIRTAPDLRSQFSSIRPAAGGGYWVLKGDGSVFGYGGAVYQGSAHGAASGVAVDLAGAPAGDGYWIAADDGSLFGYGAATAAYRGSPRDVGVTAGVSAMALDPAGQGYWVATDDGSVFGFGGVGYFGSARGATSKLVALVPTASGAGYWLATADGSVLGFGDAASRYHGSPRELGVSSEVVAMDRTASGAGYWLSTADGSIFGLGDAPYLGSAHGSISHPIVDMSAGRSGGYRLLGADGAVFTFGESYDGAPTG